ncbi:type II toxin-antitoxin system Phd/YefM family antitoxin [Serratia sp. T13T92]|uniref:type II toxin-antitoxin system Phd/YefM family antitoxin n=1 Tax=Serratia TaxID=613 RepID=UPI00137835A0|nr:type II toxin-antitoxin system prevent-host-death family antitoxin [Serratia fonticola]NBJ34233.1 type II toxin-antitoxin system prevent-host-death family antitoxin [Serratia fonticola]NXZ90043.1 type II toxin-antitoxin system prevent-host-death family antitoxin [Serratia fonticola]NYA46138.1 type II toxin-antitoxin system prevent-host-death family antitoxin [Serratia fonticola]CAI2040971.1 antitoxin YefM [Serratia fonticola]
MNSYTYSNARENLAAILDMAATGEPVEVTRRNGESAVVVSKAEFERYRKAALDAEFAEIMQTHGTAYTELSKR